LTRPPEDGSSVKNCDLRLRLALAAAALLAASLVLWPHPCRARDLTDHEVLEVLASDTPRDRAIRSALAFLRTRQGEDGAVGERRYATAVTSLAVMAHLASGVTFADPEHGAWLRRSLGYVLSRQDGQGYFGAKDDSRMYGHGMAMLMLAESLGMLRGHEDLEAAACDALAGAVRVAVSAARVKKPPQDAGGWRYGPGDRDSDLSLSGWQLMGLHAAKAAGIPVPDEVIAGAVTYAKGLTSFDGRVGYQRRGEDRPALRGLGMLCYAVGGEGEDEVVTRIAELIMRNPIRWSGQWFFYRAYYDAVGMSIVQPALWEKYSAILTGVLVANQRADGSWPGPPNDNESQYGEAYVTSMAVLALAADRHLLPAYQRLR
jgi:hypothetical protein